MINDSIVSIANKYLGKEEIQPNKGFKDPEFQKQMQSVGWYSGASWCAYLGILVWTEAYTPYPDILKHSQKLFSGNSQQMANNFHSDPTWPTSINVPQVGSLCVWGEGDSTTSGHTGIVIAVNPDGVVFKTIEGNTVKDTDILKGNEREGYIVATHNHITNKPHSVTGLNLIRFIHPVIPQ